MSDGVGAQDATETCRVCGASTRYVFRLRVLDEPASYFDCDRCGYFQTQRPHWLDRAYSDAIAGVDTGLMVRNRMNVDRVVITLAMLGRIHGRVIDHAGGYGVLVRLLRDAGVDAYWRDKYCRNLLARGFEADDSPCDLMTAFEVMEHMVDPLNDLRALIEQAPTVLLSTELIPTDASPQPDWWYLVPEAGQHIGFFRPRTLTWLAKRLGCHVDSDGQSLHLFSKTAIPKTWRPLVRSARIARLLVKWKLRSKTVSDFEALRQRSAGAAQSLSSIR